MPDQRPVNPLHAIFDRVRIICLQSRSDRRRDCERELALLNWQTDGNRVAFFDAIVPSERGHHLSIGYRGCFLSHRQILRDAAAAGIERLLVLEDDFTFSHLIRDPSRAQLVATTVERGEWDVLFLGRGRVRDPWQPPEIAPMRNDFFGTHCYAVQGNAIAKLAAHFDAVSDRPRGHPLGGGTGADATMRLFTRAYPDARVRVLVPSICDQRSSPSNIHQLKVWDRLPGVREVVTIGRWMRNRYRQW